MPTIRRTLKNVVKNYSDAQVKVREATSNDPWGPSSTLMSEVADLTYNVVAFTEIMQMVWKRLNDDGRNWRHVYKALVLLEYIIKTGSEKVAQQCKENFHAIKTLTSFNHVDIDYKDRGMNVREKAKQLVSLLSDDERLKNERAKAIKAKERFAQNSVGIGSAGPGPTPSGKMRLGRGSPGSQSSPGGSSDTFNGAGAGYNDSSPGSGSAGTPSEMENARPSSPGEEEIQLQLALALSKEEHEEEMKKQQSDEVKLQMALEQSTQPGREEPKPANTLLDMSSMGMKAQASNTDPWGLPLPTQASAPKDPWGAPLPVAQQAPDTWGSPATSSPAHNTPSFQAAQPVQPPPASVDPWGMPVDSPGRAVPPAAAPVPAPAQNDPWSSNGVPQAAGDGSFGGASLDAFGAPVPVTTDRTNGATSIDSEFDLLSARSNETSPSKPSGSSSVLDEFDLLSGGGGSSSGDAWNMGGLQQNLPDPSRKKLPEDFLGANANLVNLDQLVANTPSKADNNPFATPGQASNNPFQDGGSGPMPMGMTRMNAGTHGFPQPTPASYLSTPLLPMNPAAQPMQPQNASYNPFL